MRRSPDHAFGLHDPDDLRRGLLRDLEVPREIARRDGFVLADVVDGQAVHHGGRRGRARAAGGAQLFDERFRGTDDQHYEGVVGRQARRIRRGAGGVHRAHYSQVT